MEQWKSILWYANYEVSNKWKVRHIIKWLKIISVDTYWYWYINLRIKWKYRTFKIHRLVAQAFLWLEINNPKKIVMHLDDNPLNNNFLNLKIGTQNDNIQDCVKKNRTAWLWKTGKYNFHSKQINQYSLNGKFIKTWEWLNEVKRNLWIDNWSISRVCNWKLKKTWGFIWKFKK